jgi:hypothetical protein
MQRAARFLRFAAVGTAVWLVGGADWPVNVVLRILGDAGCC